VDIFKFNNDLMEELVKDIYQELGYVDCETIRQILSYGIQYNQNLSLDFISNPTDALNYIKQTNNLIKHLNKKS